MQRFCRPRRQTPLLVRSMNIEETRVLELRRQAVHGSGAAPDGYEPVVVGRATREDLAVYLVFEDHNATVLSMVYNESVG